jgi:hypothetical protein
MLVFTIGADELYQESDSVLFQKILRIRKSKKLKRISRWTLWNHYSWDIEITLWPFVGRFISESDIQNCFKQIDDEVLKQFKVVYKEGNQERSEFIGFWSGETKSNFLKVEIESIKAGDAIKILALEQTFEVF